MSWQNTTSTNVGEGGQHTPEYPGLYIDDTNQFVVGISPDVSTNFTVVATDTIGCSNTDSIGVYVHQNPVITRIPLGDTTVLIGQNLEIIVYSSYRSNFSWGTALDTNWRFVDTLRVTPTVPTAYKVDISDFCFSTSEEFVVDVREIYTIVLPDVFTPNGDGVNDRIYVKGGGIKELLVFKVYNRYGNLVYQTNDINDGWDGYYKNKLQNPDVYTYFVRVLNHYNEEMEAKGSFILQY